MRLVMIRLSGLSAGGAVLATGKPANGTKRAEYYCTARYQRAFAKANDLRPTFLFSRVDRFCDCLDARESGGEPAIAAFMSHAAPDETFFHHPALQSTRGSGRSETRPPASSSSSATQRRTRNTKQGDESMWNRDDSVPSDYDSGAAACDRICWNFLGSWITLPLRR
jgi:hypothetical protein